MICLAAIGERVARAAAKRPCHVVDSGSSGIRSRTARRVSTLMTGHERALQLLPIIDVNVCAARELKRKLHITDVRFIWIAFDLKSQFPAYGQHLGIVVQDLTVDIMKALCPGILDEHLHEQPPKSVTFPSLNG